MKFVDPTNDVAFRRIFGNENKKEILISFLNNILDLHNEKRIQEVEILNPYQLPKIKELKETILDVRCTDQRNISYIVEMQVAKISAFTKRVLYYTSKAYSSQIEFGEDYPRLNQVIFLGVLDFTIFEKSHYLSNHLILERDTHEHALEDFRFSFIELPKFNKSIEQLDNTADKWIYFLKHAKNIDVIPEQMKETPIAQAFELAAKFNWSKSELEIYDTISIYRQDERGRVEQAFADGVQQGLQERERAILSHMQHQGMSFEEIARCTGIALETVIVHLGKK